MVESAQKGKGRLINEMFHGIQASKHVKLNNIARTLKDHHPLIKMEDGLSRHLDDEDLTDPMNEEIGRLVFRWEGN
jgi:hypothetical protein